MKNLLNKLNTQKISDIIKVLLEINKKILSEYQLYICGKTIIPLEVETYYYNQKIFADPYVHRNDLQKNRFGQLYFHRAGQSKDSALKYGKLCGCDICLSNSEDFYFGLLIRSAKIDKQIITGPQKLAQQIATNKNYREMEKAVVLKHNSNNNLSKYAPFNTIRYGLNLAKDTCFYNLSLRSIASLKIKGIKQKENTARQFLQNIPSEKRAEVSKEIIGYNLKTN
jgi:hypothetical protein